tara:strand:- start:222 stop:689 length:468 start_codon:yes stop_codon:yes gene_type:complete
MTIIVWNGEVLAADKMADNAGHKGVVTKIRRVNEGSLVAFTGDWDHAQAMFAWAQDGFEIAKHPECQKGADWVGMMRITPDGRCLKYERSPYPSDFTEEVMAAGIYAMGSGRDYAIGAYGAGCLLSEQMVQITNKYCVGCGLGFDWAKLNGDGTI